MKVSTVLVLATSLMGAAAQYGYSGFDLEQRDLDLEQRDFELDQREIDLERREVNFKRMARAWLAARDAQDGLSRRSSPCPTACAPGSYCDPVLKRCVSSAQPPHPDRPAPPPPPQRGNNRAPSKKPAPKKGKSKRDDLTLRSSPCPRQCGANEYCDASLKQCIPNPPTRPPPPIPQGNNKKPKKGRK